MKSKKGLLESTSKRGKQIIMLLKTIFGTLAGAAILTQHPYWGLFIFLGRDVLTEVVSWFSPNQDVDSGN